MLGEVYELYLTSILDLLISSRQRFRNLVNALECFHKFVHAEQTLECSRVDYRRKIQRIKQHLCQEDKDWLDNKLKGNEISLKKMILNLMDGTLGKGIMGNANTEKLVGDIVNNRNEFTHRCRFIATDDELVRLNKNLRAILEVNILGYLGFSVETISTKFADPELIRYDLPFL